MLSEYQFNFWEETIKHMSDAEKQFVLEKLQSENTAKWIERTVVDGEEEPDNAIIEWQSAKCTNCNKYHTTPYMYYFDDFKFCPNCVRSMKNEETNN